MDVITHALTGIVISKFRKKISLYFWLHKYFDPRYEHTKKHKKDIEWIRIIT